jgi:OMF family outer membrane factor
MRPSLPPILAILATIALAGPAQAADPLTLTAAIRLAQSANYDARTAVNQVKIAASRAQERMAQVLPHLNAVGNYGQQNPSGLTNPLAPVKAEDVQQLSGGASVYNLSTGIQANQALFDGFRMFDGISQAQANRDQAEASRQQVLAQISLNTATAYFAVVRAGATVALTSQALSLTKALLDQAQQFLEAGTGVRVDVLRAQSQEYQAEQDLLLAQNDARKARQDLNLLMGRPIDEPLEVDGNTEVAEGPLDETQAVAQALASRPDVMQLRHRLRSDRLALAMARNSLWPSVSLYSVYTVHDTAVIKGNPYNQSNLTVGLNVTQPLFDGFEIGARATQAELAVQAAEIAIAQQEHTARKEVAQAFIDRSEAHQRVRLTGLSLQAAQEALDLAKMRYQAGVGTSWEVREAQQGWQQAQRTMIAARFDRNLARSRLLRSAGIVTTPEAGRVVPVPTAATR